MIRAFNILAAAEAVVVALHLAELVIRLGWLG